MPLVIGVERGINVALAHDDLLTRDLIDRDGELALAHPVRAVVIVVLDFKEDDDALTRHEFGGAADFDVDIIGSATEFFENDRSPVDAALVERLCCKGDVRVDHLVILVPTAFHVDNDGFNDDLGKNGEFLRRKLDKYS